MKLKILLFGVAVFFSYGAWAQTVTSFGGLIQPGTFSGTGGNSSSSYFGNEAGLSNTGSWNTFIGAISGTNTTTGVANTFLGHNSGRYNTTGSDNTFIGRASGYNNETGSGNVFLGYRAGYYETTSNKLYIANSEIGPPLIWGDFSLNRLNFNGDVGIGTETPTAALHVVGNARITNIPQNNGLTRVLVAENDGDIRWRTAASLGDGTGTDNQNLSVVNAGTNRTINISGGTGVNFSVADNDNSSTNEFNTAFALNSTAIEITDGGGTLSLELDGTFATDAELAAHVDADADPTNEIQTLSYDANPHILSISGGNSVNIAPFPSYPASAGDGGGNTNSYFGHLAGSANTATSNTFIGYRSGWVNTTGSSNTFLGRESGFSNTTGFANTFLGTSSGVNNTIGTHNTFLGSGSGYHNTTGLGNTFLGASSGQNTTTGNRNTFIGSYSGFDNNTGIFNTFIGHSSGENHQNGNNNTFIGYRSGENNQNGSSNVFLGNRAGENELGSNRLYIDNSNTSSPLIWGNFSANELHFNGSVRITDISQDDTLSNVLVEDADGDIHWRSVSTIGNDNLGNHQVIQDLAPDTDNTYELGGNGAAFSNIYFDSSLFINDVEFLHTLHDNIAMGTDALSNIAGGNLNVAVGEAALRDNTLGTNNTAIGNRALYNNATGNNNTAIGNNARTLFNNLTNSTVIGNGALAFVSNHVRIGNSSVTSIGGYEPWSHLSDGRFKTNVKEDIPGLDFIEELRPVSYEIDQPKLQAFLGEETPTNSTNKKAIGFVAQEIEEIINKNNYVFTGIERPQNKNDHYRIRYSEFVVPLTKAVQELSALVESQQQTMEAQQQEIETLKAMVYGSGATNTSSSTDGLKEENTLFKGFSLTQNTPNPFNKTTIISATVPETVREAKIAIYNLNGLELQNYDLNKRGTVSVEISGGVLPSGMYLYSLLADGRIIDTKKMILTR